MRLILYAPISTPAQPKILTDLAHLPVLRSIPDRLATAKHRDVKSGPEIMRALTTSGIGHDLSRLRAALFVEFVLLVVRASAGSYANSANS